MPTSDKKQILRILFNPVFLVSYQPCSSVISATSLTSGAPKLFLPEPPSHDAYRMLHELEALTDWSRSECISGVKACVLTLCRTPDPAHHRSSFPFLIYHCSLSDEEEALQPITLTKQHKGAIRAIRKVRTMFVHVIQSRSRQILTLILILRVDSLKKIIVDQCPSMTSKNVKGCMIHCGSKVPIKLGKNQHM